MSISPNRCPPPSSVRNTRGPSGNAERHCGKPAYVAVTGRLDIAGELGPHHGPDAVGADQRVGMRLAPIGAGNTDSVGVDVEIDDRGAITDRQVPGRGFQCPDQVVSGNADDRRPESGGDLSNGQRANQFAAAGSHVQAFQRLTESPTLRSIPSARNTLIALLARPSPVPVDRCVAAAS